MAILICIECGGKVSDKAKYCPHCGFEDKNIDSGEKQSTVDNRNKMIEEQGEFTSSEILEDNKKDVVTTNEKIEQYTKQYKEEGDPVDSDGDKITKWTYCVDKYSWFRNMSFVLFIGFIYYVIYKFKLPNNGTYETIYNWCIYYLIVYLIVFFVLKFTVTTDDIRKLGKEKYGTNGSKNFKKKK
ncbi:zinc ribbon domain-containing protein [[Clostridium] fimetarium]|uniref:Zinc-ribbon domain-containing protein n=1 Tax=[Clostridium] fimetarium TaxID=99656 RepID=A0A1I0Q061_9FIRM|nr:zinc ribbon domain-containing protein [[Clostridium] fimetarium]SEW20257.1 hypothetical protein SAMN05421659_106184 [[Clostridium] fimetarium]